MEKLPIRLCAHHEGHDPHTLTFTVLFPCLVLIYYYYRFFTIFVHSFAILLFGIIFSDPSYSHSFRKRPEFFRLADPKPHNYYYSDTV